ncbi:hypothetical protein LCGC14_1332320 [marine sediment metagenome]|uniref:Rhamnosyl O-methyltransferase n=1 Tax=marine sediment metagenome TaxID=412755 RepID=A0A0F9MX01_9ZZZZ
MLESVKSVDEFHIEYEQKRVWEDTNWLGIPCWKLPFDAWILQEIIVNTKPDFLIETGTGHGGSALFYASIMELVGHGKVITIDVEDKVKFKHDFASTIWNKRVRRLLGKSIDRSVYGAITKTVVGSTVMVVLDSWHSKYYVTEELGIYSHLVTKDNYLIVEDTHINNPVPWKWGDGPMEAVDDFLKKNDNFKPEKWCEKFGLTFNPKGFLRRVK